MIKACKFLFLFSSLLLLWGCDKKDDPISSPPQNKRILKVSDSVEVDISETVNLVFYMVGDAPKDLGLIEEKINAMALRDLNCTVDFQYTTWSDSSQRYNLLLSTGQPIDLIFTAEWLRYNQYAARGAFQPLDDILKKYTPRLYDFVSDDYWEAVTVNDQIYTIPSTWVEYVNEGFIYREDLRRKYGLPVPVDLPTIEAYLEGVKRNEPLQVLTPETVVDNGLGPVFTAYHVLDIKYEWVDLKRMPYGLKAEYNDPEHLDLYWGSEDFIDDMKMFKRWAEKGFWSKGALSNNHTAIDSFYQGSSIANFSGVNPVRYAQVRSMLKSNSPEIEVGYFPYSRKTGLVHPVHPIHNGFAIPLYSKNPVRALLFYEKIVLDKEYNHLTQYGIEGVHYTVDEDGYYNMIGTAATNGFHREAMNSWAWRNPDLMLYDRNFDVAIDLFREFDEYATPDLFSGFVEDYTSYQAERAALHQVQSQYLAPIQAGMVDDVEAAVDEFLQKAYDAGLEKILTEYRKQWERYYRDVLSD